MAKKPTRKTLPKNLDALLDAAEASGDYSEVYAALEPCLPDARGGYGKGTLLMNGRCTPELARWAIARGTDINAGDTWGYTPLHESARSRYRHKLPPAFLIELGADPERKNSTGLTPLHSAADGKHVDAVRVLLSHGVNVHAQDDRNHTPLEFALQRMSNIDLVSMVPVAEALLAAGAEASAEAAQFVKRAAETFEFHRAAFAADSVEETAGAAQKLCGMFGVEPPPRRVMHDGKSTITTTAKTIGARHKELWDSLVPSRGACTTVQGEVVRISGRIADEWYRNGGANWDGDYRAMADAFHAHVSSHHALPGAALSDCKQVIASLKQDPDSSERLMEWAVQWVEANPQPIALGSTTYKR
ncbi:MAG: ankyrin repeat domain-containing protein [Myxococcales bacterium]|nr:ankyrin repeat domain-containing protein [Myxococcales bacterium]